MPLRAYARDYYYWSERITSDILNSIEPGPAWLHRLVPSLSVPPFGVALQQGTEPAPTFGYRAKRIRNALRTRIIRRPTASDPEGNFWLAGGSPVLVSSVRDKKLMNADSGAVNLFTVIKGDAYLGNIAVCLFGSRKNVCGQLPEVPEMRQRGWTVSHDEGVRLLLDAGANAEQYPDVHSPWVIRDKRLDSKQLCEDAFQFSVRQGEGTGGRTHGFQRGYVLGHHQEAEWLARIYHVSTNFEWTGSLINTVFLGAPVWVRSMASDSWVDYSDQGMEEFWEQSPPLPREFCIQYDGLGHGRVREWRSTK